MSHTRRKPRGRIVPGELLTRDACMTEAGLGDDSLLEARKSGIVQPIEIAGRHYYETDQLIEWIRKQGKRVK